MSIDLGDAKVVAALIAAGGAIAAALLALISALIVNVISKRAKEGELFQNALELLTGGTQKRSVGIAIIQKYAEEYSRRDVASRIFVAQMLHLHDEGYGQGPEHWSSVRSAASKAKGESPEDDVKKSRSRDKSDKEDGKFRHIEEFNFLMMKEAVERWSEFPSGTPAAEIAKPLNLPPATTPRETRWRRALSQFGGKQRSLEM